MIVNTNNRFHLDFGDHLFRKVEDSVKVIGVKIEAARAGRINKNLCFYTPKAMAQCAETLLKPFAKHIQQEHNGEALGPIVDTEYVPELFPEASYEFLALVKELKRASDANDGKEIVRLTKELIKTPEYRDPEYRGLGITNIYADIYDELAIYNIKHRADDKGTVSIGGKSSQVYCSICASPVTGKHSCNHKKGSYYGDEVCFHIHNDLIMDHCSFVTVPADDFTNTEIVRDSIAEDTVVSITHVKSEKLMTLDDLKASAIDVAAVKKLIGELFPDNAEAAQASYEASLKNSRANHYLLTTDKILNVRTVVGIAVAQELISKMADDDESKAYLEEIVAKAKTALGVEDFDAEVEKLKAKPETEEKEEASEQKAEEEAATETDAAVKVSDSFAQEMKQLIIETIQEQFQAYKAESAVSVKDSATVDTLTKELNNLRAASATDEQLIAKLTDQLKAALIDTICYKKGGIVSADYRAKLEGRTIEQLQLTLEDLNSEAGVQTQTQEAETDLQTVEKSDAVSGNAENENQNGDEKTSEEKAEDTVSVSDSAQTEDSFAALVSKIGLAAAVQQQKLQNNTL